MLCIQVFIPSESHLTKFVEACGRLQVFLFPIHDLYSVVRKNIDILVWIGNARFGFGEQILKAEEIRLLPARLGLHPHNPASLTVTNDFSEVVTFMRTTLVPQGVLALRIFMHFYIIMAPKRITYYWKPCAIVLAFAPYCYLDFRFASLLNQIADFIILENLFPLFQSISCFRIVPDLFFHHDFL